MTHQYEGRWTVGKSSCVCWNWVARSVTPTCVNCRFCLRPAPRAAWDLLLASFSTTDFSAVHFETGGDLISIPTTATSPNPNRTLAASGKLDPACLLMPLPATTLAIRAQATVPAN